MAGGLHNKSLDGGQVSAETGVPVGSEALQIDVVGVHDGGQFPRQGRVETAVRDDDIVLPLGMDQGARVADVFPRQQRFVVGEGHAQIAAVPQAQGLTGNCPGRGDKGPEGIGPGLGNGKILAKGAAQVAAIAAQGQDGPARMEARQGLLSMGSRDVAVRTP